MTLKWIQESVSRQSRQKVACYSCCALILAWKALSGISFSEDDVIACTSSDIPATTTPSRVAIIRPILSARHSSEPHAATVVCRYSPLSPPPGYTIACGRVAETIPVRSDRTDLQHGLKTGKPKAPAVVNLQLLTISYDYGPRS